MLLPRKASFEGECFQQNREPEPRRAALVGEQLEFRLRVQIDGGEG
jgi:hypothetical protein